MGRIEAAIARPGNERWKQDMFLMRSRASRGGRRGQGLRGGSSDICDL